MLSQHLQDCIVQLCITETPFLQLVRSSLDPALLPSTVASDVVQRAFEYFDISGGKRAPGDDISDLLGRSLRNAKPETRQLYYSYLQRLSEMKPACTEYVISQLSTFIRQREWEKAAISFAELVASQKFEEAQLLMSNALKAGVSKFEAGCEYFKDFSSLTVPEEQLFVMSSGISHLDKYVRGFKRQELICVMGGPKGKKSYCLTHMGGMALLHGLNVVHISHENSQQETEERYDRWAGGLCSREDEGQEISLYSYDATRKRMQSEQIVVPCITDSARRRAARARLQAYGGRLFVKKFPMGTCSFSDLTLYLDYLERQENFVPDVLINDYPDIMRLNGKSEEQKRHQLNEIYIQLKGLADERKLVVFICSQVNRQAIRSKRPSMKDFAEDIRKAANIDLGFSICQTDEQAVSGTGSLYILAGRRGVMDVGCGIVMNIKTGQFCSDSYEMKFGDEQVEVDVNDV